MAALPVSRIKMEFLSGLAGMPSGPSDELAAIDPSSIVHKCTTFNRVRQIDTNGPQERGRISEPR